MIETIFLFMAIGFIWGLAFQLRKRIIELERRVK